MNILLINPTIRAHHPPYNFPVGLGIIAAILKQEGYNVTVYDQNALRVSNETVFNDLKRKKNIDVVAIGGLITVYGNLKQLLPGLRQIFSKAKFVLGGGVTIEPSVVFKHLPVDFCVHGEGEHTFKELCTALDSGKNRISEIPGISYVENGKVTKTTPRPIEQNLDRFPMPAYGLFPSEIYFNNNVIKNLMGIDRGTKRCATLLWSRGCPNQCTFCWRMTGRSLRFRSVDKVMEEIAYLRSNYDVDSYLFLDECINASTRRSKEFAEKLISNGFAAPWYSHARASNFSPELANLFKRSGCEGLNFGIESGSRRMLRKMKKNVTPEQASEAVKIAKQFNIRPVCTFIIGIPGETKNTVKKSVLWIRKNRILHHVFFFATPYPGCELYYEPMVQKRISEKFGTKDRFFEAIGDAKDLCLNMTDYSDMELLKLKTWAEKKLFCLRLYRLLSQPERWGLVLKKGTKILFSALFRFGSKSNGDNP